MTIAAWHLLLLLLVLLFMTAVSSFRVLAWRAHRVVVPNLTAVQRISCLSTTADSVGDMVVPTAPKPSVTTPAAAKTSELGMMEIRVGQVMKVSRHPEADGLYIEDVDVGEPSGTRTIVSGLVAFVKEEDLLMRKVIVLCNLKPRALKGVTSHGMLLCASNADHTQVTPLTPPAEVSAGELISFEGHPASIVEPGNKASKAFTKIVDDLFVNDDLVATYKNIPFMTSLGPVTATLKGKIS